MPVVDGSVRLLDLNEWFYAISEAGAILLRETLERGPSEAAATVSRKYNVSVEQVRADLDDLLQDLERKQLIEREARGELARPLQMSCPSRTFAILLRCLYRGARTTRVRSSLVLTLAVLALRTLGWAGTIATWQLALARPLGPPPGEESELLAGVVNETVRRAATRHFLPLSCKERSLCLWFLLRAAGIPAELVVGIDPFPLAGHCWCESGTLRLSDDDMESLHKYTVFARYT
jgi:hypothetical protein